MPIHFRLIACLICLSGTAFGQTADDDSTNPARTLQCTAFGGGIMSDGSTLHWSLGEPATTMLHGESSTLAQGFWQIASVTETTQTTAGEGESLRVACFPNPVGPELTVQWADPTLSLRAGLYDLSGRLLENALVQGGTHRFDFSARPSGAYLLRLDREDGKTVQTFKLQKQQ